MANSLRKRWLSIEKSARAPVQLRKMHWEKMGDPLMTIRVIIGWAALQDSSLTRQKFLRSLLRWVTACGVLGASQAVASSVNLCGDTSHRAAQSANVPANVLRAIARVETLRLVFSRLTPLPWTVSMESKGYWFARNEAAHALVRAAYSRAIRSFYSGCFQIKHRWHDALVRSLETMIDPLPNKVCVAQFLRELRSEFRAWSKAGGAYRSRLPQSAQGYRERLKHIHAGLDAVSAATVHEAMRPPIARRVLSVNSEALHSPDGTSHPRPLVPLGNTNRYVLRPYQKLSVGV